jgi:hypothetical protein
MRVQLSAHERCFSDALREFFAARRRERAEMLRLQLDAPARVFAAIREEFSRLPDDIEAAAREGERRRRGGQTP